MEPSERQHESVCVGALQLQKFPTKTTAENCISQVDVFACVSKRAEGQAGLSAVPAQQSLMRRYGCKFRRVVGCYKSDMMFRTRCQQSCNETMRLLTRESRCRGSSVTLQQDEGWFLRQKCLPEHAPKSETSTVMRPKAWQKKGHGKKKVMAK